MIGDIIRNIRKEKSLTLAELSEIVELTPGGLSQIERGIIDPSLTVIRKLSKAFNVPIQSFFVEKNENFVTRCNTRKKAIFADCGISYEFLTPRAQIDSINPKMEIVWITLKPNSWGSETNTVHEADECLIVLKGQLEIHLDGEIIKLEEADSIYFKENAMHRLYNPTSEEVIAISAMSPAIY